jgi:hypothetical protein
VVCLVHTSHVWIFSSNDELLNASRFPVHFTEVVELWRQQ